MAPVIPAAVANVAYVPPPEGSLHHGAYKKVTQNGSTAIVADHPNWLIEVCLNITESYFRKRLSQSKPCRAFKICSLFVHPAGAAGQPSETSVSNLLSNTIRVWYG